MTNFIIFSDSSSDLNKELNLDLKIVPFSICFDDENYLKENIDISLDEFYERLSKENKIPKTSLPSIDTYISNFEPYLKEGFDILCICISSTLSGSYQSSVNAKNILEEKYPERKILIIDSMLASGGQGLLVLQALKMKKDGINLDIIYEKLEKLKETVNIYFIPDTLEYLQKGGRIGKISAMVGSLLNVKPILVLEKGIVNVKSKVRGKNKAITELISYIKNIEGDINNYDIAVGNSYCIEEATKLVEKIENELNIKIETPIFNVGVTIGSHVGPGAIGVGFIKKYENI